LAGPVGGGGEETATQGKGGGGKGLFGCMVCQRREEEKLFHLGNVRDSRRLNVQDTYVNSHEKREHKVGAGERGAGRGGRAGGFVRKIFRNGQGKGKREGETFLGGFVRVIGVASPMNNGRKRGGKRKNAKKKEKGEEKTDEKHTQTER